MTNWKNIHPEFTEELQKEWEGFGFIYEQVEEWVKDYGFDPHDAEFAIYIGDEGYIIDELEENKIRELREKYNKSIERNVVAKNSSLKRKREEISDSKDNNWKNIKLDLAPELVKEWQEHGFKPEEAKDWINSGMKATDADFCAWLRDTKEFDAEWVLNYGEVSQLQSEYRQHLLVAQQINN